MSSNQLKDICQHLGCRYSGSIADLKGFITAHLTRGNVVVPGRTGSPVYLTGILSLIKLTPDTCDIDVHKLPLTELVGKFFSLGSFDLTHLHGIKVLCMQSLLIKDTMKLFIAFFHGYFLSLLGLYNKSVKKQSLVVDVDISLAPIGKIVREFRLLYIPSKNAQGIKFVSLNKHLVESLQSPESKRRNATVSLLRKACI